MDTKNVIIIGGGLAGLTAAIHLSKAGIQTTVIEKNEFPKHKVCGEYISNEVLTYFNFLEIDIASLNPVNITRTSISTVSGKQIQSKLPLGGFGVSRYALDHLLYQKALGNGCEIIHDVVNDIDFSNDFFTVTTSENSILKSAIVLGAFGKRSNIDQKINRSFITKKSPWLAVKAHYSGNFPNDVVELHNFRGGYCGVSKVENESINICYLADYESFKKHKNIDAYQQDVLCENPHLKAIFENTKMLFDKPITISQVSFEKKKPVENRMLMIGDTAGLIHPLCGNGMAMAIHSAKIAAELTIRYLDGKIDSRQKLENEYTSQWNLNFKKRMRNGRWLAALLRNETAAGMAMKGLSYFPFLLPKIIRSTHGKPLMTTI
ncbi:MAG TPA: NAD(P)/FAD-dependent oxidoreductase [Flavobacterium sp.]|nr:NAD(P)/FAD-dependent oxidoreductase [Flavobacterium sp.]